ncbi:phage tail length tape measure family protein [Rhizobium leucaenae]|uniref:phage tail length tape measure family protein n=1 Tax=Rhizobium leucaenae TaxID=29450 RepID=UPI0007EE469B|nr:phage tail length tape measure family protein [Rhizobium leucaenae]
MADQDDLIISISTDLTTVKRALTKLVGDVGTASDQISKKFDSAGKNMDRSMTTALQSRIDAMVGIGAKATNEWNGALADQGKQLDALRAKYNPLFSTINQYKSNLADLKRAYAIGAISSAEFTAAQSRERQATLASIAAIKGRNAAVEQAGRPGQNERSARPWQTANITAQFQDTFVSALGGQKPLTVGFQQGMQLADSLQTFGGGKDAIKGIAAGFASLVSPVQLVTVGLVAGAAALIQYFQSSTKTLKTMDDALKAHTDSVDLLKEAYHQLGDEIKVSLSLGGNSGVDAILRTNEVVMRAVARQQTDKFSSTLTGNNTWASTLTGNTGTSIKSLMKLPGDQAQFQPAVDALLQSARNGAPDLDTFNKSVDKTLQILSGSSDNPQALQATADAVKALGENALTVSSTIKVLGEDGKETSQSLAPFQAAIDRLKVGIADGHPDLSQFNTDIEQIGKSSGLGRVADQVIILGRELLNLNIQLKELDARKALLFNNVGPNGQLLSQGKTNTDDMGDYAAFQTQQRIAASRANQAFAAQQAGINARSPYERANAARQAAAAQYNNDETPDARKQRIQQAGMLVEIQIQHDLTEAQRDRAVALNKTVEDQKLEVSLIGKTAGETAALRKEYELTSQLRIDAAKNGTQVDQKELDLIKQKSQDLGQLTDAYNKANLKKDLSFERDQLFRTPQEQQVASRLQGAGQAVDLNSPEAKSIRQNLQIAEMQDTVNGFFTSIRDNVVSNGGNIGKALGDAIKTSLLSALTKASDAAIQRLTNSLVNAFLPSGNAAGGAGAGIGVGVAAVGKALSPGIINTAPVGAVTRASLPNIGATTDVASYIAKAAAARGIDPNTALAVAKSEGGLSSWNMQSNYVKNGVQEPSFGPFQLYKGGGLGNEFQRQTGLDPALAANGPAGVDFALDHAAKNGWGAWYGAKNTGISNWQGIGTGGANSSVDAVNNMAKAADAATKNLDGFGGGLGKLGSSLSSISLSPGSGSAVGQYSGLWGGIGKLFGGISPTSPLWAPNSTLGDVIGLADGGHVSGPGSGTSDSVPAWLSNGEFVVNASATKKNKKLLEAINGGKGAHFASGGLVTPALVSAPRAPSLTPRMATTGSGGGEPGVLNVHINGANGDDHVRSLVKQGVSEGLGQYNDSQVRGGFGSNQNKWNARKS